MKRFVALIAVLALAAGCAPEPEVGPRVVTGSKAFTESVILGEMAAHVARAAGARAVHRAELGGSGITWRAIRAGEIDIYPEYTGTLIQELLKDGETSRGLRYADRSVINQRHPRRVVATVLQPAHPLSENRQCRTVPDVSDDTAHSLLLIGLRAARTNSMQPPVVLSSRREQRANPPGATARTESCTVNN